MLYRVAFFAALRALPAACCTFPVAVTLRAITYDMTPCARNLSNTTEEQATQMRLPAACLSGRQATRLSGGSLVVSPDRPTHHRSESNARWHLVPILRRLIEGAERDFGVADPAQRGWWAPCRSVAGGFEESGMWAVWVSAPPLNGTGVGTSDSDSPE